MTIAVRSPREDLHVDSLTGEILPSIHPENSLENPYKEYVAKTQQIADSAWLKEFEASLLSTDEKAVSNLEGQEWPSCATWSLPGQCEHGHEFARVLLCGREWCPTCGEDGSAHHRRRIARLLPRAAQMSRMGYFVIEFPRASRPNYRTKESWSEFRRSVVRALKRHGFRRGLSRWHWFGDEGDKRGWNPHLNVIVDGGLLPKDELKRLVTDLRLSTHEPKLIIHYSFTDQVPRMWHRVKYVTRSTFRVESWDFEMAQEIHGYRNQSWFGSWKGEQLWGISDTEAPESIEAGAVAKLEKGVCPHCGSAIAWKKPVPTVLVMASGGRHIGAGYFELPDPGPDPNQMEFSEPVHFWRPPPDYEKRVNLKACFDAYFEANCTPKELREYPDVDSYEITGYQQWMNFD